MSTSISQIGHTTDSTNNLTPILEKVSQNDPKQSFGVTNGTYEVANTVVEQSIESKPASSLICMDEQQELHSYDNSTSSKKHSVIQSLKKSRFSFQSFNLQYEDDQKEIECDDDQKEIEYEKEKIIANDIASLQLSHHADVKFIKQSSQPKR